MSLYNILFTDRIATIEKIETDGEGTKTRKSLYKNIPCVFDNKIILSYGEILTHNDCVATFRIPAKYSLIDNEYVITYNEAEYIIKQILPIKPIIGPIQFYVVRVSNYG